MQKENFKLLEFIRQFILVINKELMNFPKKEIEIKERIRTETFDLLGLGYEANTTFDKEVRKHLIVKIISKVKVIDFLLNISYDEKLITDRKYYKLGLRLGDIAKYANSWLKNIS